MKKGQIIKSSTNLSVNISPRGRGGTLGLERGAASALFVIVARVVDGSGAARTVSHLIFPKIASSAISSNENTLALLTQLLTPPIKPIE